MLSHSTTFLHATLAASRRIWIPELSTATASAEIKNLELIAPANPGGGWDQTARAMQTVLQQAGLASSVQVQNIAGAGGTVGLAQFVTSKKRKGDAILVAGQTLQGAIITNKAPVTLDEVTPLARLVGEYEIVVVPADSPIQTAGRSGRQAEGGSGLGLLGRRLGRQHRPDPRRPDHEGGRDRPGQGQLHRAFRRWRGA